MKPVALLKSPNVVITLQKTGFLDEYEVLKPHFEKRGAKLLAVDWRDREIDWKAFEFVVPKLAWDYFDHYPQWMAWLKACEKDNITFKNSLELIKWNCHKRYLVEMQEQGASVAPLRLISDISELSSLGREFEQHKKILLKPAVSGGGKQTRVYDASMLTQCESDAREILQECDVVVQPFIESVAEGEWSFFFFGDRCSHAIKKVPQKGDFRAHCLFGAQNIPAHPSQEQINQARDLLAYSPELPHYARVDGIYVKGRLLLIELELIEPYLYLEHTSADAMEAFVEALMSR